MVVCLNVRTHSLKPCWRALAKKPFIRTKKKIVDWSDTILPHLSSNFQNFWESGKTFTHAEICPFSDFLSPNKWVGGQAMPWPAVGLLIHSQNMNIHIMFSPFKPQLLRARVTFHRWLTSGHQRGIHKYALKSPAASYFQIWTHILLQLRCKCWLCLERKLEDELGYYTCKFLRA